MLLLRYSPGYRYRGYIAATLTRRLAVYVADFTVGFQDRSAPRRRAVGYNEVIDLI